MPIVDVEIGNGIISGELTRYLLIDQKADVCDPLRGEAGHDLAKREDRRCHVLGWHCET